MGTLNFRGPRNDRWSTRDFGAYLRRRNDEQCVATSIDYSLIILTFFVINIGWFLFDSPNLCLQRGFVKWRRAAAWQALRMQSPTSLAILAIIRSSDPRDWVSLYYFGGDHAPDRSQSLLLLFWYHMKYVVLDLLTTVAAVISVYRAITIPSASDLHVYMWMTPSLAAPVTGVSITAAALLAPYFRSRRWLAVPLLYVGLTMAVACFAMPLRFARRTDPDTEPTLDAAVAGVLFAIVCVPWILLPCCQGVWQGIFMLIVGAVRTLGFFFDVYVAGSAPSGGPPYYRFCALERRAFVAFGMLLGLLMVFYSYRGALQSNRHMREWVLRREEQRRSLGEENVLAGQPLQDIAPRVAAQQEQHQTAPV